MTIWFCGDTHGDMSHVVNEYAMSATKPEAIVHLGDITPDAPLHEVLPESLLAIFWWIPGNHDFDTPDLKSRVFKSRLAHRCLHRKVTNVAGVRIAGLGGHFKGRIWMPPKPPEYKKRSSKVVDDGAIWPEDIERLSNCRADILVTHEAPTTHLRGSVAIDQLGRSLGVQWIFHGHHHVDYEKDLGRLKVVGVGFRSIVDNTGALVRRGPSERQRKFIGPSA